MFIKNLDHFSRSSFTNLKRLLILIIISIKFIKNIIFFIQYLFHNFYNVILFCHLILINFILKYYDHFNIYCRNQLI